MKYLASRRTARGRVALLIAAWACLLPSGLADDLSKQVDAMFREVSKADGPGGVCFVVQDGQVAHRGLYGLADVEKGTPFTPDTMFDLASVSKQFTGLAAALLIGQGRLSLQDEARKHLPELRAGDPERPILVRHVASMTTGLSDYMELLEDGWDGKTNDDVARAVGAAELQFPTGTKYEYSNTDYNLLATIIQRASKNKFGEFLREAVFAPCGMKRTRVLESADAAIPDRAVGYRMDEKGHWGVDVDDTPGIVGDGSVFSCAADLVRFDAALRGGKVFDERTLRLWTTPGTLDSGETLTYALGLEIDPLGGHRRMYHSGSWNGTSTHMVRFLDVELTVIILLNYVDGELEELGDQVALLYLGELEQED